MAALQQDPAESSAGGEAARRTTVVLRYPWFSTQLASTSWLVSVDNLVKCLAPVASDVNFFSAINIEIGNVTQSDTP
jgi:hypothetical protein